MLKVKGIMPLLIIAIFSFNLGGEALENTGPTPPRNFMLVFDLIEYSPQVKDAVTYFFNNVFQEGDRLIIISPAKLFGFSPEKLRAPKKEMIQDIVNTLKTDIEKGMKAYRNIKREMNQAAATLGGGDIQSALESYRQNRKTLSVLRGNLEERLEKFAKIFIQAKSDPGENHLVMILQKEYRPIPSKETMDRLRTGATHFGFQAAEVFLGEVEKTGPPPNIEKLESTFKYARVKFHLLYLIEPTFSPRGIGTIENSVDIRSTYAKIARATGGIDITSTSPSDFFKKVEQVMEGKVEVEVIDETMKEEEKKE